MEGPAGGARAPAFEGLVAGDEDDQLDLGFAALAVAADAYPELDAAFYVRKLDALAFEVGTRLRPGAPQKRVVEELSKHLFEELGFKGNMEHYYDPQNSYLNRVLDRRLGIPISLSLLYLETGRRLGLPMAGVGLPGHFLVKVIGAHEEILIDPFYEGAILDRAACQRRLDAIYGGKVQLTEQFLRAVSKREMLARMLYNLKRIHLREGHRDRAVMVLDKLLALQPFAFEDQRDRGMLRYQLGQYAQAMEDLQTYLSYLPAAHDAPQVQRTLRACERLRAAQE